MGGNYISMTLLFYYKPIYSGIAEEGRTPIPQQAPEEKRRKKRAKVEVPTVPQVPIIANRNLEWDRIKSAIKAEIQELREAGAESEVVREALSEIRAWHRRVREKQKLELKRRRKEEHELLILLELLDD